MRILLDNGVFSHSEFAAHATKEVSVRWVNRNIVGQIHGFARKAADQNLEYQRQKEALFTVGRLIREGRLKAYVYIEILFEKMRGKGRFPVCDALKGCDIEGCPPALDRFKFVKTLNFREMISKGGRKDRKAGVEVGTATQIAFLKWLCSLRKEGISALIEHAAQIGLDEFEAESLRNIDWFQFLCRRWGSSKNYPDVFHLWTSERNGLDAVLTLDEKFTNFVSGVRKGKTKNIEVKTEVLRPLDLLRELGIDKPDPVSMDSDRFYNFLEVTR
jgi:hypothetical protein